LGKAEIHDERDCECLKYVPDFKVWDIRLNGINLLCRKCNRYIDPKKWKGGIIKFQKRSRYAKAYQCPCCGQRLSSHRYSKKKLEDSVNHQIKYPELHDPRAQKALKKKKKVVDFITIRQ